MKIVKFLFKSFLIIASIPIVYILVSFLFISITVNNEVHENPTQKIWKSCTPIFDLEIKGGGTRSPVFI